MVKVVFVVIVFVSKSSDVRYERHVFVSPSRKNVCFLKSFQFLRTSPNFPHFCFPIFKLSVCVLAPKQGAKCVLSAVGSLFSFCRIAWSWLFCLSYELALSQYWKQVIIQELLNLSKLCLNRYIKIPFLHEISIKLKELNIKFTVNISILWVNTDICFYFTNTMISFEN